MSCEVSHGNLVPRPTFRACPVFEPVHGTVKFKPDFRRHQCHIPKVVADLLFPCRVAVFQEPLVMQDLDFNFVATATDDRPVSNSYIIFEVYFSIMSAAISSRATRTGLPPYLSKSLPLENSGE